jgi:hypothetical protein
MEGGGGGEGRSLCLFLLFIPNCSALYVLYSCCHSNHFPNHSLSLCGSTGSAYISKLIFLILFRDIIPT